MSAFKRIPVIVFFLTGLAFSVFWGCAGLSSGPAGKPEVQLQSSPQQSEINSKQIAELKASFNALDVRINTLNKRLDVLEKKRRLKKVSRKNHPKKHLKKKISPKSSKKRTAVLNQKKPVASYSAVNKQGGDPLKLYHKAYKFYASGKFKKALVAFSGFLKHYPAHPYANNALYWQGESYYSMSDYEKAAVFFKEVIKKYPKGNKAPDALLKLGYTYAQLGKKKEARAYLFNLMDRFPFSEAAQKAQTKLDELY